MGAAVDTVRHCMAAAFLVFASAFVLFTAVLQLLRRRRWCTCEVCAAYMSGSWRERHENLCDWYTELLRRSPTQTVHIHVLRNTVTANAGNVEHMLRVRFENYPKGKPFSAILGDLLGRGIFNVDGDRWRFQRKMASLELGSHSVRSHAFSIITSEIRSRLLPFFAAAADGGAAADLQDVFRRFSFDNICRISFGVDPGCLELSLPMNHFAAAFDAATGLSARRAIATCAAAWKVKRALGVGSEGELRRAVKLVDELAGEVIRQRRKLGCGDSNDLLSRFMSTVDDDRYLRDIVISFLLAGRDTVASGLTSFFMLLARHPGVRDAIREEILRVSGGAAAGPWTASYDELRGMHYAHAALYEAMRLYPPVQFDSKFCADDDVLPDGTYVARDTRVTYHPYAMGRMENLWGADWPEFRPERWLSPAGAFVPASPFKYPVFQAGLRVCLGKEMALMEMKAVVVAVVRSFDVELPGGDPHVAKFAPGLTATLAGGLPAVISKKKTR